MGDVLDLLMLLGVLMVGFMLGVWLGHWIGTHREKEQALSQGHVLFKSLNFRYIMRSWRYPP